MNNIERVQIHKNLTKVLEDIRKKAAVDMKKKYNLTEINIPRTLASQILAAKMSGKKNISFKIRKAGMNKGFLELL